MEKELFEINTSDKLKYSLVLSYFNNSIELEVLSTDSKFLNQVEQNLSPFILKRPVGGYERKVKIETYQINFDENIINSIKKNGTRKIIDSSLYKESSSDGTRLDIDDQYFIHVDKTGTIYHFIKKEETIRVYNVNQGYLYLDTIRLIKSLISLQSEKEGNLILHSSGVVLDKKQGILFMGDSRNGKTTILLEVLTKFSAEMLSCDTSSLSLTQNTLKARGWPSNFSISLGTIHDYPELYDFFPKDKSSLTYSEVWEIFNKDVLDTYKVMQKLKNQIVPEADVSDIIFLNFDINQPTQIRQIFEKETIERLLNLVYLGSRDPLYPNWHEYTKVDDGEIENNIKRFVEFIARGNVNFYCMDWAPGPESLLKRVDSLGAFNKNSLSLKNIITI